MRGHVLWGENQVKKTQEKPEDEFMPILEGI